MGDHADSRDRDQVQEQRAGKDRPENDDDEPDAAPETDNPLAHVDPDSDAVTTAGAAKGSVNDPADDPLWNPAMEPHTPENSRAAHPAASDGQSGNGSGGSEGTDG
ncbi:hypothetical protein [Arthrobacter sp. A5]|uniref:hypothetical protein n=1 Tax=Arthrobacter sp. A5 TaxID=576926 RepID=UPI003DA96302